MMTSHPFVHRALALCATLLFAATALTACGGRSSAAANASPPPDAAGVVWLCRSGVLPDPCVQSVDVTSVSSTGALQVVDHSNAVSPKFDCFYVYPTVSTQTTDNANLKVQAGEIGAAISQASPFSQVCRVYAPMYKQRTEISLLEGLGADQAANNIAYQSLLLGWRDYLAHYNDGRPVIFIGHSQGAAMLIRLLESQIDTHPALRALVVSVVILGGNVQVPTGKTVGAAFKHLPLCKSANETGCVIAYSSFPTQPPSDSEFGIPGQGVSLQSDQRTTKGVRVACVNPASLSGGVADLSPWFLTSTVSLTNLSVSTEWVTFPGLYTASCESHGTTTWLQVTDVAQAGDVRPAVSELLGPAWGYHQYDVNLALGNLVSDVQLQEATYLRTHA
jgi:hypothetical protein